MAKIETIQPTFDQVRKFLLTNKINRSAIARQMYPKIKSCSAAGKFANKLAEHKRFRFTEKEEQRLIQIVTKNFKIA